MKIGIVAGVLLAAHCAVASAAGMATLYTSYLRYEIAGKVSDMGASLCEGLVPADAAAVREALEGWKSAQTQRVRRELEAEFGDVAQERFGGFIETLLGAEEKNESLYLVALGRAFELASPPSDYAALRQTVMAGPMAEDMKASAFILGSLQSWTQWKREGRPAPPLTAWLTRSEAGKDATQTTAPKPKAVPPPPGSVAALAAAEGGSQFAVPEEGEEEAPSPLAAYSDLVKQKREQMFKDSTAASEQLLAQRKEWEDDQAQKKTAAAEAEAESVKKHAEALAQADKDAIEQQQNSWQNKLKGVASALVSSAVGAFTGGVGTQAGEKLAEAVFKDK